jgi:hypothetical protein
MTIAFHSTIPAFRILSLENAREFYGDFLGRKVDWERRFAPETAAFMRVSRDELSFYLKRAPWRRHAGFTRLCPGDRRSRIERQELSLKSSRSAGAGLGHDETDRHRSAQ